MAQTQVQTDFISDDAITTAKIAANAVTSAKLATDAITTTALTNASVTPAKLSQPLTQGTAQASTSGTSIDFTSIPSWVKRITVMFNGVSTSGNANPLFQLGSGSVTSSGYLSTGTLVSSTTSSTAFTAGFGLPGQGAATILHGVVTFYNVSGNVWVAAGTFAQTDAARNLVTGGNVTLSGVLDRVRITTSNGTDTFDAGSINILYE